MFDMFLFLAFGVQSLKPIPNPPTRGAGVRHVPLESACLWTAAADRTSPHRRPRPQQTADLTAASGENRAHPVGSWGQISWRKPQADWQQMQQVPVLLSCVHDFWHAPPAKPRFNDVPQCPHEATWKRHLQLNNLNSGNQISQVTVSGQCWGNSFRTAYPGRNALIALRLEVCSSQDPPKPGSWRSCISVCSLVCAPYGHTNLGQQPCDSPTRGLRSLGAALAHQGTWRGSCSPPSLQPEPRVALAGVHGSGRPARLSPPPRAKRRPQSDGPERRKALLGITKCMRWRKSCLAVKKRTWPTPKFHLGPIAAWRFFRWRGVEGHKSREISGDSQRKTLKNPSFGPNRKLSLCAWETPSSVCPSTSQLHVADRATGRAVTTPAILGLAQCKDLWEVERPQLGWRPLVVCVSRMRSGRLRDRFGEASIKLGPLFDSDLEDVEGGIWMGFGWVRRTEAPRPSPGRGTWPCSACCFIAPPGWDDVRWLLLAVVAVCSLENVSSLRVCPRMARSILGAKSSGKAGWQI